VKVKDPGDEPLRIGELAARTGTSARSLRYYEQQGLLRPDRDANGYRRYPGEAVTTVRNIRALLSAGLGTGSIGEILPCAREGTHLDLCPRLIARLADELDDVDRRLDALQESRALLSALLSRGRQPGAGRRSTELSTSDEQSR
jgi:DNA-binding transcriptional MerR regulator